MTDKGKQFIREAQKNEALKREIEALNQEYQIKKFGRDEIDARISGIAKKYGFEINAEDVDAGYSGEVDDNELEAVAGGNNVIRCDCSGHGVGSSEEYEYAELYEDPNKRKWCVCIGEDDRMQ